MRSRFLKETTTPASNLCEFSSAYYLSTTTTRLTLPLRSKPSCTRVPARTICRSTALPSLPTKRTLLPSMYDTGLVSGEDSTTIGEGGSKIGRASCRERGEVEGVGGAGREGEE